MGVALFSFLSVICFQQTICLAEGTAFLPVDETTFLLSLAFFTTSVTEIVAFLTLFLHTPATLCFHPWSRTRCPPFNHVI